MDKILSSEREDGHEVQVRENYRQSGYKRVWDTVLSNYINMITIQIKMHANTLSYVLVLASVFQQIHFGLISVGCRYHNR